MKLNQRRLITIVPNNSVTIKISCYTYERECTQPSISEFPLDPSIHTSIVSSCFTRRPRIKHASRATVRLDGTLIRNSINVSDRHPLAVFKTRPPSSNRYRFTFFALPFKERRSPRKKKVERVK